MSQGNGRGQGGHTGIPFRGTEDALQRPVSAHGNPHQVVVFRLGGQAEETLADLRQFVMDESKIPKPVGHVHVEASLHLGNYQGCIVLPYIPLHAGVPGNAGAVVLQAVKGVEDRPFAQGNPLRQYHGHGSVHVQHFRTKITTNMCHYFRPLMASATRPPAFSSKASASSAETQAFSMTMAVFAR